MIEPKDICLINCSNPINTQIEWDEYTDFRDGVSKLFESAKPTKMFRSWHSLPACLETEFFVFNKPKWEGVYKYKAVILLVNRDLSAVIPLIKKLKMMGKKVAVGHHENWQDMLKQSMDVNWLIQFKQLIDMCDAQWNVILQAEQHFRAIHDKPIISSAMAIPFDEWHHDISVPLEAREGVVVGTRTLNQHLPRNTWSALFMAHNIAKQNNTFVSYLNEDPVDMQTACQRLGLSTIRVSKGPLPSYEDWLSFISKHRVLYHADEVHTLGQVITDAVLVNVPFYGGNTDNNLMTNSHCSRLDREYEMLDEVYQNSLNQEYIDERATKLKTDWSFGSTRKHIVEGFDKI